MEMERDIELAEDAAISATHHQQQHGNSKSSSGVAVKWFHRGQWRRFHCAQWTFAALMSQIRAVEPNFRGQLFYRDNDGDAIFFNSDLEMHTMSSYFREHGGKTDTVKLESQEDAEQIAREELQQKQLSSGTSAEEYAQKPIHPNVICDMCDGEVRGIRYKCLVCPDFDLCEQCEKTAVHGQHPMCRLATKETPKPPMGQFFPPLGPPTSPFVPPLPLLHRHHHRHPVPYLRGTPPDPVELQQMAQQIRDHHQQKFEAKWDKMERKCTEKIAKREQKLRDRVARTVHRMERFSGGNQANNPPAEGEQQKQSNQPSAPPAEAADVGQQSKTGGQPQQPSRVDYLKEVGQRVQQALMSFGIECDAEVQDANGVVHGRVPFPASNNNLIAGASGIQPQQQQAQKSKPVIEKKLSPTKCPFLVDVPMYRRSTTGGVLQRPQLCPAGGSLKVTKKPKAAGIQSERLRDAIQVAEERVRKRTEGLKKVKSGSSNKAAQPTPPPTTENSSGAGTPRSSARLPPSIEAMEQAEIAAALAAAQEAAKKASQVAISSMEAASQLVGEILSGFDPNAGQTANRIGNSIVEAARQGAENFVVMLQQQNGGGGTPMPQPTTPTAAAAGGQEHSKTKNPEDGAKIELAEEVSVNAHIHNEGEQKVAEQQVVAQVKQEQPAPVMSESALSRHFSELHVKDGRNEVLPTAQWTDESGDDSDVEILEEVKGSTSKSAVTVQLGSKRKLEVADGDEALMNVSTHTAIEMDKPPVEQGKQQGKEVDPNESAAVDPTDMVSLSSRSSTTSSSSVNWSSAGDEDDGPAAGDWMVVKKESFKKLCDFYEKRRRLEKDGDPFAAQLEREFREALAAIAEDEKAPEPKEEDQKTATTTHALKEGQIVDLTWGNGDQVEQLDGMVGHSASFFNPPPVDGNLVHQQREEEAQQPKVNAEPPPASANLYPVLVGKPAVHAEELVKKTKPEVCTAGVPYPGYQKPTGDQHRRECAWKHGNLVVQRIVDQLVEMGFDNCNGWLFCIAEKEGTEIDRIFQAIDADPLYSARVSLE